MCTAFVLLYILFSLALCPFATAAAAAAPSSLAISSTRGPQPNATAISCTLSYPAAAIEIIAATLRQPPNAGVTTTSLSTGPLMMYMPDGALAPSTIVGIIFFSSLFIALQVALLCVWRKRRTNAASLPPPASSSSSSAASSSAGRSSRDFVFTITLPMPGASSSASRLPQAQAVPSKEQDALESDIGLGMDGHATELVIRGRPPPRAHS